MARMIPLTTEQRRRTIEALADTNRLLAREQAYLPHLQKPDVIASYERHIVKLVGMLEANEWPDPFCKE